MRSGTRFGQRIAHGALLVGMVSAVLGVEMAGKGSDDHLPWLETSVSWLQFTSAMRLP